MSATDVNSPEGTETSSRDSATDARSAPKADWDGFAEPGPAVWTADDFSPIDAFDPDDPRYETDEDPRIPPGSSFFKIGEVAKLVGVKPYVLRFWEGEFSWVRPEKTSTKQRRYRRQDVAALLQIRRLRYDAQLTIARTRELIKDDKKRGGGNLKRPEGIGPVITVTRATPGLLGRLAELRAAALELLAAVEE